MRNIRQNLAFAFAYNLSEFRGGGHSLSGVGNPSQSGGRGFGDVPEFRVGDRQRPAPARARL